MTAQRQCSACAKVGRGPKPLSEFRPHPSGHDGLTRWCREHLNAYSNAWRKSNPQRNRAAYLKAGFRKRYGLTLEQYQSLHDAQDGACAICKKSMVSQVDVAHRYEGRANKVKTAHVDHCHATGLVRGLLCSECNLGIGHFRDSADLLRRAAAYLEQPAYEALPGEHA